VAVGPDVNPGEDPHAKHGGSGYDSWLTWPKYKVFVKESEFTNPKPAELWVILDEEPDSINDGCFAVQMPSSAAATGWVDYPSKAHGDACGFAFADGHSEIHKWVQPDRIANPTYTHTIGELGFLPQLNDPDILWLAKRTSGRTDGTPLPY